MPQYEWDFSVSFPDLWTLLFKKKSCRQCGGSLTRRTVKVRTYQTPLSKSGKRRLWHREKYRLSSVYDCHHCRWTYTLAQLRAGDPGEPMPMSTP